MVAQNSLNKESAESLVQFKNQLLVIILKNSGSHSEVQGSFDKTSNQMEESKAQGQRANPTGIGLMTLYQLSSCIPQ